ncbi:MAG: hypothetical protein K8F30_10140, partial [Taibaiella sp.]|nr:hypothetical protein [Taibaiella sp.]
GQPATYNINKRSGILSNHIYTSAVDKHGYLWIGTTDGIYRYNGYMFKKFDYEDGLPNTDIWHIYKDSKGRIWPITIAEGMGYFSNGKYVPVTRASTSAISLLYPAAITETGDSLIFFNKATPNNVTNLVVITNDTLYAIEKKGYTGINLRNFVAEIKNDTILNFTMDDWLTTSRPYNVVFSPGMGTSFSRATQRDAFGQKYIYSASLGAKQILFYNVANGQCDTVNIALDDSSYLHHCFSVHDTFYAITASHLFAFDTALKKRWVINLKKLIPHHLKNVPFTYTHANPNTFWGLCLATDKIGLFINYPGNSQFREKIAALDGYTFSGYRNDSTGLWWNSDLHKLAH